MANGMILSDVIGCLWHLIHSDQMLPWMERSREGAFLSINAATKLPYEEQIYIKPILICTKDGRDQSRLMTSPVPTWLGISDNFFKSLYRR